MPFAIIVNVQIKEDRIAEFKEVLRYSSENSRKEEGCLRFDVLVDNADPTKFAFYEVYKNQDALGVHKTTEHYGRWASFKESGGVESQAVQIMSGLYFET